MKSIHDHTQFFARIHIHGLTSEHGERKPITLERHISFPPPVRSRNRPDLIVADNDLSPRVLDPVFDLIARVRFDSPRTKGQNDRPNPGNSIGYGRAGLVFPLEVLSISPSADPRCADLIAQLPPLCIKVATPGYARSLAREAWFYEYIDGKGLTGVIAPRCYGVFHAALGTSMFNTDLKVDIPNYDYYSVAKEPIWDYLPHHYTAPLWEEYFDNGQKTLGLAPEFVDDRKGSYELSPWRLFRQSPKVTTLTILVMDLLGEPMTVKDFDEDWDVIEDMYEDLAPIFIVHHDDRFPNLLRVPPHAQRQCKTHGSAHKWNFIDWENASLQCDTKTTRRIQRLQILNIQEYGVGLGGVCRPLRYL
ncbi:hypothetical protein D9613_008268 [Agrocybe pediades]|uniref:Uncharacterized protein n=1 Tax=Agrocybe pediades TaxID=84607 RepID=A0A8H4QS43_9AGAR|nr:hypothetical protein D9613_008268 [Agrocybe pediades]